MNARLTWPDRRPAEEAELDQRVWELIGEGPENNTPEDWAALREQMRLQVLYPGLLVAFRDHHQGEGPQRRLVWREVLCSALTLEELSERLDQLGPPDDPGIKVLSVEKEGALPWLGTTGTADV